MNERIKQLAEQANAYAISINPKDGDEFETAFEQKLAELIVKECAGLAEEHMNMKRWPCASDAAVHIKKHFGVE